MARTWWSITVELVSGRGEYFWPRPGRVLIARPGWTFRMLADGINKAFGRWELSHLHRFVLADGSSIAMAGPWDDLDEDDEDDTAVKLTRLRAEEAFAFTFDYGDGWDHLCTVGEQKIDPVEEYGAPPDHCVPIFGWGALPDQHGRRFVDDDGDGPVPRRPDPPTSDLPPLLYDWGMQDRRPMAVLGMSSRMAEWDLAAIRALRAAVHNADLDTAADLFTRHDASEVAQIAAPILIGLARRGHPSTRFVLRWVVSALVERRWDGDRELAHEISAGLGEEPELDSIPIPVDLDMLASHLEERDQGEGVWYLDTETGEWIIPEPLSGVELPDDLEVNDRYLPARPHIDNEGWYDMAAFIEQIDDRDLAEQLDRAIHGRGAFRSYGDLLRPNELLWQRWQRFREERQLGRARLWLEVRDYRPKVE